MNISIYAYIFVMAGVTYLIRVLPLAFVKREITNPFVRSFLFYVPYACLAAMTFPSIITGTASVISGTAAFIVGILVALRGKSLVTVALCACTAVFITERILSVMHLL